MTTTDIETAFKKVIEKDELKHLDITKFTKYNLVHKPCSTARKLEILWMLGKLKLNEPTR